MAKIYVSSTYLDLKEHREQVERVIRRMGHEDVAMEYYVAEDTRPVAKCLADVAACDVYVGIYAWRYGWQPKDDNPGNYSITEMEFRQAEKSGKPCLIFVLSDDALWLPKHIDDDKSKINNLRNQASVNHPVDYFSTPDELGRRVAEAIHEWEKEHGLISSSTLVSFDVQAYYAALRKRYAVLALEGLTPPQKEEYLQIQLRSVFVEQSVRENPPPVELPKEVWEKLSRDKKIHPDDLPSGITLGDVRRARDAYYEKPSHPVLDVLTDSRYQHAIILGDPGSGKSTLARYVMLSLISPVLSSSPAEQGMGGRDPLSRFTGVGRGVGAYLPLLIELRSYAGLCAEGNGTTFLEFLEFLGKTEGWHLTQAALHNHLKNDGRAVVIFDGLDEIFEPELRETITNRIVGFTTDYPKARVIVTSRVIGYRRKILTDAGFTHFTLQDLDESQVETFVNRWYDLAMSDRLDESKERRERILKSFKESASIRQLAGNPMLLTIMAIIGKHQELPRERWKLYDHAASVLIQHWDVNKHLKDARIDADFIGEDDKKELLRRLAFRMQNDDGVLAGNYIHREQLQAEFESYLRERYAQTPERAAAIARAMTEQFRERSFILSLYGSNLYGFIHRAFLEYFCASAFVYRFEKTQELTIDQLKTEVYGKRWADRSWHETLRLICVMIDEKWTGDIIDYLATDVENSRPSTFEDVTPWNISLAVQCLGSVTNITAIGIPAMHLLNVVCSVFNHYMANEPQFPPAFESDLMMAIKDIGTSWPYRSILVNWLKDLSSYEQSEVYTKPFGLFVGSIGKGLDSIFEILVNYVKGSDRNHRVLAIGALRIGWSDNAQVSWLLNVVATHGVDKPILEMTIEDLQKQKENVAAWISWLNGLTTGQDPKNLPSVADGFPVIRARSMRLRNIRVFSDTQIINLADAKDDSRSRSRLLFLGDNAAGKSTLLKCIALAALGPAMATKIEKRPQSYLRYGADCGWIEVAFELELDNNSITPIRGEFCVGLEIREGERNFKAMKNLDMSLGAYNAASRLDILRGRTDDKFGFVCGYGSLRMLSDNADVLLSEEDTLERVTSLFRPSTSLIDSDVLSKILSGDLSNFRNAPKELATSVCETMATRLKDVLSGMDEITSVGSPGVTMYGVPVSFRDLSDGYSSLLALVGHIFRHALAFRNWNINPTETFGLVLIDEVDLHLHPAWQRRVFKDLSNLFPNLQIIATSHSAMVAGSVSTDSITILRREGNEIRLKTQPQSIEGWRVDQILTSLLFDLTTTRNIETEELFNLYADLLDDRGPEDPEVKELGARVSKIMELEGEGTVDQYTHALLDRLLREKFESLDDATRKLVIANAGLILSRDEEDENDQI